MVKHKTSAASTKKSQAGYKQSVTGAKPYQPKMSRADARSFVESSMGRRIKLAKFRGTVKPLTSSEREVLIDQAILMLEQMYAHLPLKRSLHANDPVQSLRLLRLRQASLDELAFQSALMEIFIGLRDLHTNYVLPGVYAAKFAFLPFRIEEFYEPGGVTETPVRQLPKYIVSWVSPVNAVASLKEGMVVTHWNGSPINLAVARNGEREAGSNVDARREQGIEALTLRWLGMSLPPDEDWVNLTYTDGTKTYDSRFEWEVIDDPDRAQLLAGLAEAAADTHVHIGLDLERLFLDRARKLIFDPQAIEVERETAAAIVGTAAAPSPPRPNTSLFPDVFPRFGKVTTPSGDFGYIRLKTFAPRSRNIAGTVAEFGRILTTLPESGLILDVRGNGGGYINIGERILQMLTPQRITPEPFHFLATGLTLKIASETGNGFDAWKDTIIQGLESGASYSQGFPLTDPEECNNVGQIYQGPVVLITDALCYSTTDIFSAGFQDHQIGPILGCHSSTGAGGATVWDYDPDLLGLTLSSGNPFVKLPEDASMRVAALRCTRVGNRSGIPVEDYGVVTDNKFRYFMTRKDVVDNNEDLIAAAGQILKSLDKQTLRLTPDVAAPTQKFSLNFSNVDRVDVFVNDRPAISEQLAAGQVTLSVQLPFAATTGSVVSAWGYRNGALVVSTQLPVNTR